MRRYLPIILLLLEVALWGCERPFIEERPPDIEIISPNLDVVQIERTMNLRLRATSLNEVDSVLMNGLQMSRESGNDIYAKEVNLARGVNRLFIRAFGSNGGVRDDTLAAVYLPGEADIGELKLPSPRGGHTATKLLTGDLLVVGGASLPTSGALDEVLLYDRDNLGQTPQTLRMAGPRMEHTATRLPNGTVLIVGGSTVERPTLVEQLVERVELYRPGIDTLTTLPVKGDPIRRSGHTAVLFPVRRNSVVEIYIYLFGGYGDIAYRPSPRMGVRSDIRAFQIRNDSLIAAGPTFGPFIEAMADLSATEIQPPFVGSDAEYLFAGSYFASESNYDSFAFESDFSLGNGILIDDLDPMTQPRSGHAAERMVDGEIIIFGGRTFSATTAMSSIEVYQSRVKRFYPLPNEVEMIQQRWGHTATNWGDNRILIVGGFGYAGAGLTTSEWFTVSPRPQ